MLKRAFVTIGISCGILFGLTGCNKNTPAGETTAAIVTTTAEEITEVQTEEEKESESIFEESIPEPEIGIVAPPDDIEPAEKPTIEETTTVAEIEEVTEASKPEFSRPWGESLWNLVQAGKSEGYTYEELDSMIEQAIEATNGNWELFEEFGEVTDIDQKYLSDGTYLWICFKYNDSIFDVYTDHDPYFSLVFNGHRYMSGVITSTDAYETTYR